MSILGKAITAQSSRELEAPSWWKWTTERTALPICHLSSVSEDVSRKSYFSSNAQGMVPIQDHHKCWGVNIHAPEHAAKAPHGCIVSLDAVTPEEALRSLADHLLFCLTVILYHLHRSKEKCPAHERPDYASEHLDGCCASETALNEASTIW